MGIILKFTGHHLRSSVASSFRAAKAAKISRVMEAFPKSEASLTTLAQWGLGMPLERQPLTVDSASPRPPATTPVPPIPSMMSAQFETIESTLVRTVRTSQVFATSETTISQKYGAIVGIMDPNGVIAARLIALRKELGEREGIMGGYNQTQFAEKLDLTKSTYNPFETGKRPLTFETACLIRRRFGIPIDWLFFGDMPNLANEVLFKLGPEPKTPVRTKRTVSHK